MARQTSPGPLAFRPGIAIGRPLLLDTIVAAIPTYAVESATDVTREIARLRSAIATAVEEFDNRIDRLRASLQADRAGDFRCSTNDLRRSDHPQGGPGKNPGATPERGGRMAYRSFLATRPTRKKRTIPTFGLGRRTSAKWNEPF